MIRSAEPRRRSPRIVAWRQSQQITKAILVVLFVRLRTLSLEQFPIRHLHLPSRLAVWILFAISDAFEGDSRVRGQLEIVSSTGCQIFNDQSEQFALLLGARRHGGLLSLCISMRA